MPVVALKQYQQHVHSIKTSYQSTYKVHKPKHRRKRNCKGRQKRRRRKDRRAGSLIFFLKQDSMIHDIEDVKNLGDCEYNSKESGAIEFENHTKSNFKAHQLTKQIKKNKRKRLIRRLLRVNKQLQCRKYRKQHKQQRKDAIKVYKCHRRRKSAMYLEIQRRLHGKPQMYHQISGGKFSQSSTTTNNISQIDGSNDDLKQKDYSVTFAMIVQLAYCSNSKFQHLML